MNYRDLEWTGERLVTDVEGVIGVAEHLHRYALATRFVAGKHVLDIASGEGYGSNLLSKVAARVTGVDISADAVHHAKKKYASLAVNLNFKQGNAAQIPLEDDSVDVVTSFETLEHTTEHEAFFKEIRRVLKPNGLLIISTPDTVTYKQREPINPYHVKELDTQQFMKLVNAHFAHSTFLQQRCVVGSFLSPLDSASQPFSAYSGNYDSVDIGYGNDQTFGTAYFNIAFASDDQELIKPAQHISLFNYVPELLKEFSGSIGLMYELRNAKKDSARLTEIEQSRSYRMIQAFSSIVRKLTRQ